MQMFVEVLLCTRYWATAKTETAKLLALMGLAFKWGGVDYMR